MRCSDLLVMKDGREGGRIIAFSRIYSGDSTILGPSVFWRNLLGEHWGGLGPMGVDPARRGLGLGLRLLYESLVILKKRGVNFMVIDWTDLPGFYARMGFTVWKTYSMFGKSFTSTGSVSEEAQS
jgi:predicted N-acetyltransferase YhbS